MSAIRAILAKEILDSQGNPTISVSIWTDDGFMVESSVSNGSSSFPYEAKVLLDNDPDHKSGKGVQKAVQTINQSIAPQLIGQDPTQQDQLDQLLLSFDGTELKTQYGANTLAALSQTIFKAGSASLGMSVYQRLFEQYHLANYLKIPTCIFGLINGGKYGSSNLDLQEFLIIPASHMDYRVSLEIEDGLRTNLQQLLKDRKASYSTGVLGGFTPSLQKNVDVFEFMIEAAHRTDYILSRDFFFGLDAGAENLVNRGKYVLRDKSTVYTNKEIYDFYKNLKEKYNLTYFEDPFTIQDLSLWQEFTKEFGSSTKIAMDAFTVSSNSRIQNAIQNSYANAIMIKPSQIGTVTEAILAVKTARDAGWSVVVSQRSGETNDDFLADFAVGIGADFIKFGPTNRGESVEKYNRLADIYLEIEQQMLEGENMNQTPPQDPITNQATDDQVQPPIAPPQDPLQPTTDQQQAAVNPFMDQEITTDPAQGTQVTTPTTSVPPAVASTQVNQNPQPASPQPVVAATEQPTQATTTPPVQNLSLGETPAPTPTQPVAGLGVAPQPPMNNPAPPVAAPNVPPPQPAETEAVATDIQEAINSTVAEISPSTEPVAPTQPANPQPIEETPVAEENNSPQA